MVAKDFSRERLLLVGSVGNVSFSENAATIRLYKRVYMTLVIRSGVPLLPPLEPDLEPLNTEKIDFASYIRQFHAFSEFVISESILMFSTKDITLFPSVFSLPINGNHLIVDDSIEAS